MLFKFGRYFLLWIIRNVQICLLPFLLLLLVVSVWNCKNNKVLPKEDAVNSLKILNSDIVNFADVASEKPEISALKFIWKEKSSPVPWKSQITTDKMYGKPFAFQENTGVYYWNEKTSEFSKIRDTSLIYLRFPLQSNVDEICEFSLRNYKASKINSRPDFPENLDISLLINKTEKIIIQYSATIEEGFPSVIHLKAKGDEYSLNAEFNRKGKVQQKTGKVNCNITLNTGLKELLSFSLNADINYHYPTYSLQFISITQRIFGTILAGTIDYGAINPTAENYAEDFNKHCDLNIYSSGNKGKIGRIILGPVKNADQLDFFVQFGDKSLGRLSEYILLMNKLLNIKY